jgi:hypothetical protein
LNIYDIQYVAQYSVLFQKRIFFVELKEKSLLQQKVERGPHSVNLNLNILFQKRIFSFELTEKSLRGNKRKEKKPPCFFDAVFVVLYKKT